MRIAISNIAWDVFEDEKISELLSQYQIDAIDIAPGKYFPDPTKVTDCDISKIRAYWEAKGIEITGMQSLLFGKPKLNVFGSVEVQQLMLNHLNAVARIAAGLGIKRLVFGSPRNRNRKGLSDKQSFYIAKNFFTKLGNIANQHKVIFCLEPNPVCYGANFMTNSKVTFDVVSAVNHPAIKMQLDTGSIILNKESISEVIRYSKNQIGHIHISEPGLEVIGDIDNQHTEFAKVIKSNLKNALATVEMIATQNESHIISIERALSFVTQTYRAS